MQCSWSMITLRTICMGFQYRLVFYWSTEVEVHLDTALNFRPFYAVAFLLSIRNLFHTKHDYQSLITPQISLNIWNKFLTVTNCLNLRELISP